MGFSLAQETQILSSFVLAYFFILIFFTAKQKPTIERMAIIKKIVAIISEVNLEIVLRIKLLF
jgi:hypothetical protein